MQTYAHIVDGVVFAAPVSLPAGVTPADCYPPAVAATFVACPPGTVAGAVYAGGVFTPPSAPALSSADLGAAINAECKRRIYAVASDTAQMNVIGAAVAGALSSDDMAAYRDAVAWIAAMRAAAQALIAAGEQACTADSRWPPCPADVAALAARF